MKLISKVLIRVAISGFFLLPGMAQAHGLGYYFSGTVNRLSVDFDNAASAGDVERAIARLDREIKQTYPKIKRIFVEAEDRRTGHDRGDRSLLPDRGSSPGRFRGTSHA